MRILLATLFIYSSAFVFSQEKEKTVPPAAVESTSGKEDEENKKESTPSTDKSNYKKENSTKKTAAPQPEPSKVNSSAVTTQSANSSQSKNMSQQFMTVESQSNYQRTQRSPSPEQQAEMEEAVRYFEKQAPHSFEYHYFKYVAGNYNIEQIEHLEKAEQLKPENADVQIQLAAYYIILHDQVHAANYLKKLATNKRLTEDVINYGKDLLLSVPQNGTLVTHGFDDTYACAYLQETIGFRKDVHLISLDFLQSEAYGKRLKKEGYLLPLSKQIDIAYLTQFCRLNEKKNISLSLTIPKEYFTSLNNLLYVNGLTLNYCAIAYGAVNNNSKLWEQSLEKKLIYSATNEKAKQLSANYLPMLLELNAIYERDISKKKELKEVKDALDKVAVQCGKYDKVQQLKSGY